MLLVKAGLQDPAVHVCFSRDAHPSPKKMYFGSEDFQALPEMGLLAESLIYLILDKVA